MSVEKFGKLDHKAIVEDQKAAAAAEGRAYISAEEKIRLEEGEEAYQAELKKQADEKAKEEARAAKLSPEQRKAEADREAKLLQEFNEMRKAAGRNAYTGKKRKRILFLDKEGFRLPERHENMRIQPGGILPFRYNSAIIYLCAAGK